MLFLIIERDVMITLQTPINSLGYGVVGYNIARSLAQQTDISLIPISFQMEQDWGGDWLDQAIHNGKFFRRDCPSLKIFHEGMLSEIVGKPTAGLSFFESFPLSDVAVHHFNSLDMVFVASKWAQQVCFDSGVKVPVCVVPMGTNRDIFNENVEPAHRFDCTVFANYSKYETRKGMDLIVESFNMAFEPSDKVLLVLAGQNPFLGEKNKIWERKFLSSKMGVAGKIMMSPRVRTQNDLACMMAMADCGIYPHRAEGWCLTGLDLLSMGKHLIITDYSGSTEYADPQNSRLVPITGFVSAKDEVWDYDFGNGQWGQPDLYSIVEHMRDIYKLKMSGSLQPNVAGIETAKKFSWAQTASKILNFIEG